MPHHQEITQAILSSYVDHKKNTLAPFIIGISGAQGCGKTTLSKQIKKDLTNHNIKSIILSLDDFYLTKIQRDKLACTIHPLLKTRGVPGTHDIHTKIFLRHLCLIFYVFLDPS